MTIERVLIKGGFLIDPKGPDFRVQLANEISRRNLPIEELPEGSYDMTPPTPWGTTYKHDVTVFQDGTAMYRLFPKLLGVGTRASGEEAVRRGGRIVNISEDNPLVAVTSLKPVVHQLWVYDLLLHEPGPSPRRK